jgi:squalene synthase HpnC
MARAEVRRICAHYENFSMASILLPPRLKPPMRSIYAFARFSDDLADEEDGLAAHVARTGLSLAELRRQRLRHWSTLLDGLPATAGRHPILMALAEDAARHALPIDECRQLLDAFLLDQEPPDFPDDDAVLAYCRRSAAPVGRLLLALNGLNEQRPDWSQIADLSDRVCAGLQLANFWQDLSRDLPSGRLYVPRRRLAAHGLPTDPLALQQAGVKAAPLLQDLAAWAREQLSAVDQLAPRLPWRFSLDVRLYAGGGLAIVARTEALGPAVLTRRPVLGALIKFRVALVALRPY